MTFGPLTNIHDTKAVLDEVDRVIALMEAGKPKYTKKKKLAKLCWNELFWCVLILDCIRAIDKSI